MTVSCGGCDVFFFFCDDDNDLAIFSLGNVVVSELSSEEPPEAAYFGFSISAFDEDCRFFAEKFNAIFAAAKHNCIFYIRKSTETRQ